MPTTSNGLDKIIVFSLLYYHNPYGLRFVNQEPGLSWTIYFVKEQGKFMDSKESAGSIGQWLADSTLHNEEYQLPADGFHSFNQFFARNLKPGMRPIARANDSSVIVSPVDGIVNWIDYDLKRDSALPLKGRMKLNLDQLFGHSPVANYFVGGTGAAIILLPQNYHHYHSPVSGTVLNRGKMSAMFFSAARCSISFTVVFRDLMFLKIINTTILSSKRRASVT